MSVDAAMEQAADPQLNATCFAVLKVDVEGSGERPQQKSRPAFLDAPSFDCSFDEIISSLRWYCTIIISGALRLNSRFAAAPRGASLTYSLFPVKAEKPYFFSN